LPKYLVLSLLLGLALLASGCARIAKPSGWARPAIVDGTLYVSLDKGKLSALDATSYEQKWVFPGGDQFSCGSEDPQTRKLDGIYGEPVVGQDLVYFGAYDSRVYAVKKDDGSCQWSFDTGDPIVAGLVLDGERLYVPSTDGNLYVLDSKDGKEVTRREKIGDIWATPLLTDDGGLYVPTMDGELLKFSTNPLEPVWSAPFKVNAGLLTTPVLTHGDTVVVGGIGKTLYGANAQDGQKTWSVDAGNWFWGEPAIAADGTVFATSLSGAVYRVDPATGDSKKLYEAVNPIRAGVVLDGDTLITVDSSGLVLFLNAQDGTLIKDVDLKNGVYATPVVNDGRLFVLARSGSLFSIDLESYSVQEVAH
jgi:outer membrane protein assembly factor BamB